MSEGTKLYGMDLSEARLHRSRLKQKKGKRGIERRSNREDFGAPIPESPHLSVAHQLPIVQNAATSSSQSSTSDPKSTPLSQSFPAEAQYNDPIASVYDVPLPFPVSCWVTPANK